MSHGSLFTGIGLLDYGLMLAGLPEPVWVVEQDDWRRNEILARRFPDAVRHDDVRTVGAHNLKRVQLIVGGFPCKGASTAGPRNGFEHPETVLWREMARIVRELRPRHVLLENVANLLALHQGDVWGEVLGDLATLGYDTTWDCLPAAAVGAPHRRDRVFAIARRTDHAEAADIAPVRRRVDGRGGLRLGPQDRPAERLQRAGIDSDGRAGARGAGSDAPPLRRVDALPGGNGEMEATLDVGSYEQGRRHAVSFGSTAVADCEATPSVSSARVASDARRFSEEAERQCRLDAGTNRAWRPGTGRDEATERAGAGNDSSAIRPSDVIATHADGAGELGDRGVGGVANGRADARRSGDAVVADSGRSRSQGAGVRGRLAGSRGVPVEWGSYGPAIHRWERELGRVAPEPLVRRVDDRRASRVERSRLSALGDGVQVQVGQLVGAYLLSIDPSLAGSEGQEAQA